MTEKNPGSKLRSLEIHGIDKDAVVFKLDETKIKYKSSYLAPGEKGLHSGCDYVIATKRDKRNILLFCELKSNDCGGGKAQLRNSLPFVEYLLSLLRIHKSITTQFEMHHVLFSTSTRIKKQRVKNDKLKKETFPERPGEPKIDIVMADAPEMIHIAKIIR